MTRALLVLGTVWVGLILFVSACVSPPAFADDSWMGPFLRCVAGHESHHNPRAEDPRSTASGLFSFLDSTWWGNAYWTKVDGHYVARKYRHASHAPASTQWAVALHSLRHGGKHNWQDSGC